MEKAKFGLVMKRAVILFLCSISLLHVSAYAQGSLQTPGFLLGFENQADGTTNWQENGYQWSVSASTAAITFGDAAEGNFKLDLSTGNTVLQSCGSYNLGSMKMRTAPGCGNILNCIISGFDAQGQLIDTVDATDLLNQNPYIYVDVFFGWSAVKELHVDFFGYIPAFNNPGCNLFIDSVVYNLNGVPCTSPFATINQPVLNLNFSNSPVTLALDSISGTCLNFQWQVDINDGNGFVDIGNLNAHALERLESNHDCTEG